MAFLSPTVLPRPQFFRKPLTPRRPRPVCKSSPPQPAFEPKLVVGVQSQSTKIAQAYLQSLGLSPEDVNRTLSRHPRLRTPHLSTLAEPTVTYLRTELGLSARQTARAIRHAPQILFQSRSSFSTRLSFLEDIVRIPATARPAAIAKCPHILWMDLTNASAVVDMLVDAMPSLTPTTLGTIFSRVPQALIRKPEELAANIDKLRNAGVKEGAALGKVFSKAPLALVYSLDTLQKRLDYLAETLHSTKIVGKVLVATPQLLSWSVEKSLIPRITLLSSLVGAKVLPDVFDKVPTLFAASDMLDRVLWLRDVVGLTDEEIRKVLQQAPAILTYSIVGNLAPKWTFIQETMGGSKYDIVAAPRETLCANLQQRHMPRYAFLAGAGRTAVSVVDILRGSDHEFCRNIAICEPGEFRRYVDNDTYLLFFSQLM